MPKSIFQVAILITLVFSQSALADVKNLEYKIVVDAGSSGSRLTIFEIERGTNKKAHIKPKWNIKEKKAGGIHNVGDLSRLPIYLDPLIEFAKATLSKQKIRFNQVPVLFRASAGMRNIEVEQQKIILNAVDRYFESNGFRSAHSEVLSGAQEGIFAWIAVNYLMGTLGDESPYDTYGLIEMGGASTQITFLPIDLPKEHGTRLTLEDKNYDLYSYSYEGFGQQRAMQTLGGASCFQRGIEADIEVQNLINSTEKSALGDFASCKQSILKQTRENCSNTNECGLQSTYQPPLRGNFIAIGGFAQLQRVFDFSIFSADSLDIFGKIACKTPWAQFKKEFEAADLPKFLATACFEAAYYSALLSGEEDSKALSANRSFNGLGFSSTSESVTASVAIGGQEISWALGLVVFDTLRGSFKPVPAQAPIEREEL